MSAGAGLVVAVPRHYLPAMSFISRFSPFRAYRDLRLFLSQREPYELGFLALAIGITSFLIFAFARDSHVEPVYRRNIVYVEQWPLTRTDAEIRAQQKIDAVEKTKRVAEQKAREDATRTSFKRLDDKMEAMGL